MSETREKLITHINRKEWWHCPPQDPQAYQKRGKFLASSFREAEFWGRPLDHPQHVTISNPLIGDEASIETELLGKQIWEPADNVLEWRWKLDKRIKKAALARGYDSVVLMTLKAFIAFHEQGKIPRSIELNVLRS